MCDCGKVTIVQGNNLRSGGTSSCGCNKKDKNLIGQRFGRLIVLMEVSKPKDFKNSGKHYLCRCDCGKEKRIFGRVS